MTCELVQLALLSCWAPVKSLAVTCVLADVYSSQSCSSCSRVRRVTYHGCCENDRADRQRHTIFIVYPSLWRERIIVRSDVSMLQTSRSSVCSSMSIMSGWRPTVSWRNCESETASRTKILHTYFYLYGSEHPWPQGGSGTLFHDPRQGWGHPKVLKKIYFFL